MKLRLVAVTATAIGMLSAGGLLSACSSGPSSARVPTLSGSAGASTGATNNLNAANGDGSAARRTALHNAAECIRQHGAPRYQDPVLTADGRVYTDERALYDAVDETQMQALETACGELIRAARFSPGDQAPPPPKVIQAGVKSAQCMRANGLPNWKDPTVKSRFIPGKGFGMNPEAVAHIDGNAKEDPTVQRALNACRSVLDEEARLSSLGSLGDA